MSGDGVSEGLGVTVQVIDGSARVGAADGAWAAESGPLGATRVSEGVSARVTGLDLEARPTKSAAIPNVRAHTTSTTMPGCLCDLAVDS